MKTTAIGVDPDALIGQTIQDRYTILEQIGSGGMGTVFKARQKPIGRIVALKILLPDLVNDDLKLKRFVNEARILSSLRHPNTVSLVDFGRLESGQLFIVMDYVHNGTLRDMMDNGRMDQVTSLRVTRQILSSLGEAHERGVIHRDLKPCNVLLDEVAGEHIVVKVADFGIAKLDEKHNPADFGIREVKGARKGFGLHSTLTSPGMRLGTPQYIPPEQAFAKPIDARADFYAMGVILYEMLTGHLPFKSDSDHGLCLEHLHTQPPAINDVHPDLNIDPYIEAVLLEMMAKKAEHRPNRAKDIIRVIDEVLARVAPAINAPTRPMPVFKPPVDRPPARFDDETIEVPTQGIPTWLLGMFSGLLLGALAAYFII